MLLENKIPKSIDKPAFIAKLKQICEALDIEPDWLMLIMYHESGFNPHIPNSIGAVGLIQFMPKTATWVGTSQAALLNMSAVDQLYYVWKFYKMAKDTFKIQLKSFFDLYLCTFFPIAVGKPDNWTLHSSNISAGSVAAANGMFDLNKDNQVTVGEFKQYLKDEYLIKKLKLNPKQIRNIMKTERVVLAILLGITAAYGIHFAYQKINKL